MCNNSPRSNGKIPSLFIEGALVTHSAPLYEMTTWKLCDNVKEVAESLAPLDFEELYSFMLFHVNPQWFWWTFTNLIFQFYRCRQLLISHKRWQTHCYFQFKLTSRQISLFWSGVSFILYVSIVPRAKEDQRPWWTPSCSWRKSATIPTSSSTLRWVWKACEY